MQHGKQLDGLRENYSLAQRKIREQDNCISELQREVRNLADMVNQLKQDNTHLKSQCHSVTCRAEAVTSQADTIHCEFAKARHDLRRFDDLLHQRFAAHAHGLVGAKRAIHEMEERERERSADVRALRVCWERDEQRLREVSDARFNELARGGREVFVLGRFARPVAAAAEELS